MTIKRKEKNALEGSFLLNSTPVQFLGASNIRPDGRSLLEGREFWWREETVSDEGGISSSVICGLGYTKAIIHCEITESKGYSPSQTQGNFAVNLRLHPLSASMFSNPRARAQVRSLEVEFSRIFDKVIRGSEAIDLEALGVEGKIYALSISVLPLNYDGNLVGISVEGALHALRLLQIKVNNLEQGMPFFHEEKYPLFVNFFGDSKSLLLDPTLNEELSSSFILNFGVNRVGEELCICGVQLLKGDIEVERLKQILKGVQGLLRIPEDGHLYNSQRSQEDES